MLVRFLQITRNRFPQISKRECKCEAVSFVETCKRLVPAQIDHTIQKHSSNCAMHKQFPRTPFSGQKWEVVEAFSATKQSTPEMGVGGRSTATLQDES
jgi:hypothetical protein